MNEWMDKWTSEEVPTMSLWAPELSKALRDQKDEELLICLGLR